MPTDKSIAVSTTHTQAENAVSGAAEGVAYAHLFLAFPDAASLDRHTVAAAIVT